MVDRLLPIHANLTVDGSTNRLI